MRSKIIPLLLLAGVLLAGPTLPENSPAGTPGRSRDFTAGRRALAAAHTGRVAQ